MEQGYFGPAFKDARVHNVMRVGVVTCRPQTKLSDVARMMVGYDIHSVVVAEVGEAIKSNAPLEEAASLMAEHGISHLIAVQPDQEERPAGMISARDLTLALAYGRS